VMQPSHRQYVASFSTPYHSNAKLLSFSVSSSCVAVYAEQSVQVSPQQAIISAIWFLLICTDN
jgi:hypothetical protein